MTLSIQEASPDDADAKRLLALLSDKLLQLTGNDGTASFSEEDVQEERSIFLVAWSDEEPVGCGGLRPLTEEVCELKRMYAKYPGRGIGSTILQHLERYAQEFGYKAIWLETRKINVKAVQFYLAHRYRERSNYGKYIGRREAICFEKEL